jgi:hypothetical protein
MNYDELQKECTPLADVARVFGNDTSSFNEESGSNNE